MRAMPDETAMGCRSGPAFVKSSSRKTRASHWGNGVFCQALNSAEKIETVEGAIESVEATGPFSDALQSALYKEGIACMAALAGSQSACKIDRKTVAAKFVLAERNELWLEKINEISTKDGIPFYAFGAGHFLPNAYGPGLLTMLQKAGFTVKLIRTLSDVPPSILKRKPLKKRSRKEQAKP
jgi:hypothetical protein